MGDGWWRKGMLLAGLLVSVSMATEGAAAPIGFNTALPVSRGEIVWRALFLTGRAGLPDSAGVRARNLATLQVIGYGLDARLALFGALPVVDRRLSLADGMSRSAGGIGDLALFARWTAFAHDRPGRTWRLAPFFGVRLATGAHHRRDALGLLPSSLQPDGGSTDPFFGLVMTAVGVDTGVDIEWRQDLRRSRHGMNPGNVWQVSGSFQRRLLTIGRPARKVYGLLYGLLELSYRRQSSDRTKGGRMVLVPARRMAVLRPGLQFAARRFILEGAVELPFSRSRISGLPRERWLLRAGIRMNF